MAFDLDSRDGDEPERREIPRFRSAQARRRRRFTVPLWVWGVALLLVLIIVAFAVWWLLLRPGPRESVAPPPTATRPAAVLVTQTATPSVAAVPSATWTPAPVVTPTVAATITIGGKVQVVGTGIDQLRVRTGPGVSYVTMMIVPDGTVFEVLDGPQEAEGYNWWRLKAEDGTVVWAADEWLEPVAP